MKANNWIVLGISLLLSLFFLSLYFYLGFQLIDYPTGLLLTIVWWIAIIAVGFVLNASARKGKHHRKGKHSMGTAAAIVMAAILAPCLALSTLAPGAFGVSESSTASSAKATSTETGSTSEDLFYYKLDPESTGIELYYCIEGGELTLLEPGEYFSCARNDKVEMFVKPVEGYQTDMTFLHSGNASQFIAPNTKGLYNRIGTGELPGFTSALDQAIALGCTKEFHYSTNWDQFRYRQLLIVAKPVAITVTYDLDGGTLDGSATYADDKTYYDSDVTGHADSNIITLPSATPTRKDCSFAGWRLSTEKTLYEAGSTLNVDDFWKYIQKNANDQKIVFPMKAVWNTAATSASSSSAASASSSSTSSSVETTSSSSSAASTESSSASSAASTESSSATAGTSSSSSAASATSPTSSSAASASASSGNAPAPSASSMAPLASHESSKESSAQSATASAGSVNGSSSASTQGSAVSMPGSESSSSSSVSHTTSSASLDPTKGFKEPMPGTVNGDAFAAHVMRPATSELRTIAYTVTDTLSITSVDEWNGIAYANRGCWVCYYMIAGIIATLLYGAGVLIYRKLKAGKEQA